MATKKPPHHCVNRLWVPAKAIDAFPEAQVKLGRHRCAVCAYAAGYADGLAEARRRLDRPSLKEPKKRSFFWPPRKAARS